ncbi:hypothetical protein, variant [Exophiala mesophila]|uniref:D-xylose reductase [NAD(P)H] n=1 Tax=Exophiala mesophila TaxID=212818 RepID=A0A0D1X2V5_EXOME|nr:hypothetical protein, variant [Exophiala mesophila]KIV96060.1 hypothetical protein, variant [Exophiala mesophila]
MLLLSHGCQSRLLAFATFIVACGALSLPSQTPSRPESRNPVKHIPNIGLGLWNSKDDDATKAVGYAFSAGYHHLDGAAVYDNEPFVGTALNASSSPPRHRYWLTSKLWNTAHRPKFVRPALEKTLSDLNTTYLDLYLMHWPVAFRPDTPPERQVVDQDTSILDTWRAMEDLVSANLTRYIGVSNFSPRELDALLKDAKIKPFAHEFETHPYLQQQEWVDWHHKHDIKVIAYSPLANSNPTYHDKYPKLDPILADRFWNELALDKNITTAQAILGWGIQRGTVVIPKSVHQKRILENLASVNVSFTNDELAKIAQQDRRARFNDPGRSWGVELFEGLDGGSNRFLLDHEL